MTQEKREMAIGLQLDPSYAQLTYFNRTMKDPVTLETAQAPEGDPSRIEMAPEVWTAACGRGKPIELVVEFFKSCFQKVLPVSDFKGLRVMVTVPKLEPLLGQRLAQALTMLGVERKYVYLQDYLSSFYYYTINQRRELWNRDVALLECVGEQMVGYVMHTDWNKTPALVRVEKVGSQNVDEKARDGRDDADWNRERDRLFFELLKKVFERRSVTSCYLVGDYFSRDWAERSFQYLVQGRHAFQGKNLYTRGACYGAMERSGMLRGQELLFLGADIVQENFSIQLRVKGKETNYPLVTAGVNWYEAHRECEFIPEEERTLTIWTKPMTGGEEVAHLLRLDHFPERPPRASRLKMSLYFTSPSCCCVEVEDLGFGGFYRASGRRWSRRIYV